MPDYSKGKIYCIRAPGTEDVYIGSTTQPLSTRMAQHRRHFKCFQNGTSEFISSFKLLEKEGVYIELIEDCPCDNKEQLDRREGEVLRSHTSAVNKLIPGRTRTERNQEKGDEFLTENREYAKKYYWTNRDEVLQKKSVWGKENREKINSYKRAYRQAKRAAQVDAKNPTTPETALETPEETNAIVDPGQ